jgi:hypothetical protein
MFTRLNVQSLIVLVGLFFASCAASAAPVTLHFNELPNQPVDNVSIQGVTFDFKIGGLDNINAFYNAAGPGTITHLQHPVLEGNATGILTFDFVNPTPILSFGIAMDSFAAIPNALTVTLFDQNLSQISVQNVNLAPTSANSFTEGLFSYGPGTGVRRAVLDFNTTAASRFAVDNLTFDVNAIPTPQALAGGSLLLAAVTATQLLRRKKA